MAPQSMLRRFLILSVAVAALLVPIAPKALAAEGEDMPFDKGCEVADASLDTIRGGFAIPSNGAIIPFGLDLHFDVFANGHQTAGLDVSNGLDKGKQLTVTQSGLGVANVIAPGQVVTTSLTNQGIMTVIQNARSNTALATLQTLNATVTGLGNLIHTTAQNGLHNSRILFH